ncbi:DUF4097 domain-containing protein [Leadbetterella sp. DM7]|uniref:DUF4097 family beta strand repeat-containing protein n=1 Tax=Leadbetterella sp. DM7 TaxID=3235085 RepID=UPI00349E5E06
MKTRIIFALLLGAALTRVQAQNEKIVVELSQPGKPYTVDLSLVHGSIHVVKSAGKELVVEATPATGKTAPVQKDGMRKISSGNNFDLTVKEAGNKVQVVPGIPIHTVNITLQVPDNGSFRLRTVSNGDIKVENVSGEFELSNVNGGITLQNISGSAVANTTNGGITATFNRVSPDTPMAFSTLNGKIDLSFPASFKGNIRAKTDQGDVYSDFEIGFLKEDPKVVRTGEKGFSKIETTRWVTGTLNGGGPEVMMKTVNGSIYIRKAK